MDVARTSSPSRMDSEAANSHSKGIRWPPVPRDPKGNRDHASVPMAQTELNVLDTGIECRSHSVSMELSSVSETSGKRAWMSMDVRGLSGSRRR